MPSPKPKAPLTHPLAGLYADSSGRCYVVPAVPTFSLFRAGLDGLPLDPHRPTQDNADAFTRALGWATFKKL